MTDEENKPKYLEDMARYQYADVAHRFISNKEDAHFAKGALEKMVESFGIDKELFEGFKEGAFASEDGAKIATQIYAKKYQEALGSLNVSEFYDARLETLKSILGEEKAEKAKAVFEKYEGKTVGSILKDVAQSQAIINDQTGLFDEKKKKEAQKKIEKLASVYTLIKSLEDRKYEELRAGATKSYYKEMLNKVLEAEKGEAEEKEE